MKNTPIAHAASTCGAAGRAAGVSSLQLLRGDCGLCQIVGSVGSHKIIMRAVQRASAADHTALATMMTGGGCVWAGIVYSEREGSETTGWVETFHVSELDQLVQRLGDLQRILGGESSAPSSASASSSGSSSPSSAAEDGV